MGLWLVLLLAGADPQTATARAEVAVRNALPDNPNPRISKMRRCEKGDGIRGTYYGPDNRFHLVRRWKWIYIENHVVFWTDDGARYVPADYMCRTGRRIRG